MWRAVGKEGQKRARLGETVMKRYAMAAAAAGFGLTLTAGGASAADVILLCSNALKSVLEELGPQFEKASGHKLTVKFGTTGPLQAQIEKGEAMARRAVEWRRGSEHLPSFRCGANRKKLRGAA